jgi:SAM-dependent methyltransferase
MAGRDPVPLPFVLSRGGQGWGRIASAAWAGFYDRGGTSFAVSVAPRIRAFYETTPVGISNRNLLDVCCGTGQLARHFLDHGYRVTGIDFSEQMLRLARLNVGEHLDAGRARFILADACDFAVERKFGLATSTFDALNLLPGLGELRRCLGCVRASLVDEGIFVFDLMTRRGFIQDYDAAWVFDTEESSYRSVFDGEEKARARMSGVVRDEQGQWDRFEEYRELTFFPSQTVVDTLGEIGWGRVWIASTEETHTPLNNPEAFDRVFFVATS